MVFLCATVTTILQITTWTDLLHFWLSRSPCTEEELWWQSLWWNLNWTTHTKCKLARLRHERKCGKILLQDACKIINIFINLTTTTTKAKITAPSPSKKKKNSLTQTLWPANDYHEKSKQGNWWYKRIK